MGDDLDKLEEKIEMAKAENKPPSSPDDKELAARQIGMRAGSEFMAYIFSGCFVGWLIGNYFGGMALWIMLMMFLGFGMGIYRASQLMK